MKKTKGMGDLILVVTLGWLGIHKFKEKKTGMGLAYMFTFGLCGFGWIYDIYKTAKECGALEMLLSQATAPAKSDSVPYIDSTLSLIDQELTRIDAMSADGWKFEQYAADILRLIGYSNVTVTTGSGDYGIDILAEREGVTYAIQCKCYSNPVGNKAVQEAFSGKEYYKKMVAVVLTNSTFTSAALKTAAETRVLLWDRAKLREMILQAKPELSRSQYPTKELI